MPRWFICAECAEKRRIEAVEVRKIAAAKARFGELVTALGEARTPAPPTIVAVATGMAERFGGIDGFCDFWHNQIAIAADPEFGKPGSRVVLEACKGLARVFDAATPYVNAMPDTLKMTDNDLKRELADNAEIVAIGKIIEKVPEMRELLLKEAERVRNEPAIAEPATEEAIVEEKSEQDADAA